MPYISQAARDRLDPALDKIFEARIENPGDLTYLIYRMLLHVRQEWKDSMALTSFVIYSILLGCTEAAKLELYRRHVAPYENQKVNENGDVLS